MVQLREAMNRTLCQYDFLFTTVTGKVGYPVTDAVWFAIGTG